MTDDAQTANYYQPQDISLALRINMEDKDRGYSTRELLPFVADSLGIPPTLPVRQRSIMLGIWLRRNLIGRPFDGFVLKSWIGEYNIRLYKFIATDLPDDAHGLHAAHVAQLRTTRDALESQRRGLIAAAYALEQQVQALDSVIAAVR